jgi:hypothetical protein
MKSTNSDTDFPETDEDGTRRNPANEMREEVRFASYVRVYKDEVLDRAQRTLELSIVNFRGVESTVIPTVATGSTNSYQTQISRGDESVSVLLYRLCFGTMYSFCNKAQ